MKHQNNIKVYYVDTDSYGIVWHGAYLKWFEVGRVELSGLLDIDFKTLEEMKVQLPVVELNCRYKSPARVLDELVIETSIGELKKTSITFSHRIFNKTTDKLVLTASSMCVTTDLEGKMHRRIPEYIYNKFNSALEQSKEKLQAYA